MLKATQKGCHAKYTLPYRGAFHGATRTGSTAHVRFPDCLPRSEVQVWWPRSALRRRSSAGPHLLRILSILWPHYSTVVFPHRFRSISAVSRSFRCISAIFPHCFRCISAVFPLCFPVSPHCCRSPSAVFGCVNWSEKTVAETLSNQRLMYSAMVLLFNTLSVCSLLLMSPLPLF